MDTLNLIRDRENERTEKFLKCFTEDEMQYLDKNNKSLEKIEEAIDKQDYKEIRRIKKKFYTDLEKGQLKKLEDFFGEEIWVYFVDKVSWNKDLRHRFKSPKVALLYVDDIIKLARELQEKGIKKDIFINNYLGVAGDRALGYEELNNFLKKYNSNWQKIVEKELEYDDGLRTNSDFKQFVEDLKEKENSGELYKNLDEFGRVLSILSMIENKKILIDLQKLARSSDPKDKKLYEYYRGVIYHPKANSISMEMLGNPLEFLCLGDTTFSELKIFHGAKMPSHMVNDFELLDLTPKDLVDCLPLGVYDQLSYFKPFEMKLYICGDEVYTKEELQQKIGDFLVGAEIRKISAIINKLKEQGDTTEYFNKGKLNKDKFIKKLLEYGEKYGEKYLIDMFMKLGYSEFNKYKNLREMTAKIGPKSDPNNWFNGFSCDSLADGHGKKVVAMFNPYCTDFCIYEGDYDSKEDNLKVTSWVTLNRAIPGNFRDLIERVVIDKRGSIVDVLGDGFEKYKDSSEYVITMDNIEVKPNFLKGKNKNTTRVASRVILKMYERFFSEYVRRNPISPNGIPIGTGRFYSGINSYKKLDMPAKSMVLNESLPIFENSYTDNIGRKCMEGELKAGEQKEKEQRVGIYPLSIEDITQILYMRGKIYGSSERVSSGSLQHEITASILNNQLKGRKNLSFVRYNSGNNESTNVIEKGENEIENEIAKKKIEREKIRKKLLNRDRILIIGVGSFIDCVVNPSNQNKNLDDEIGAKKKEISELQDELKAKEREISELQDELKNRNRKGKIGGYIFAYQGMKDGTPLIFVSDFLMDKKVTREERSEMIHYWLNEVRKNYPNMPIFMKLDEKNDEFTEKNDEFVRMIADYGYKIIENKKQGRRDRFRFVAMNPENSKN